MKYMYVMWNPFLYYKIINLVTSEDRSFAVYPKGEMFITSCLRALNLAGGYAAWKERTKEQ